MLPQSSQTTASPSLTNLVTEKLTYDNFLLWKVQIVPIAKGYGVMDHLDGLKLAPSEFVELEDDKGKTNLEPNLEYEKWYAQDQQVSAWINSTLSPEILAQKVCHVLASLGEEYKMFATIMLAKPPLPSCDDLKTLLLQHELAFNITSNASSRVIDTPLQSSASHNVLYTFA
ncbi:hypothetical protein SLEP1_g39331 [Rubroshorea leprosula]|uniref:Retrotransposon Copia-like N-terminal domain-containing protein n=1 Tax=Rubroshorea leprosula TaxID=152421 RepID=A0AAV5L096_9ROSI|nr:hypothetical protein SLEP1_g39331 [Rubroshorea leprosula]